MKFVLAILTVLVPASAFAQQAQPYVPIVLEKEDAEKLNAYLVEQPVKFALPIMQLLATIQQRQAAKAAPVPKPTK